ncbi:MAG: hypothetical protein ACLTZH_08140, partial [Subdoligranulum sp.]
MLFFVMQLKWGYSLIAGAFTLAIMVSRRSCAPRGSATCSAGFYREGRPWPGGRQVARTVFTIVSPSAMPGILSGVILGNGPHCRRNRGPAVYTASTVAAVPASVFSSTRTLPPICIRFPARVLHIMKPTALLWSMLILSVAHQPPVQLYCRPPCQESNAERNCMMNKLKLKTWTLYSRRPHALKISILPSPKKRSRRSSVLPAAASPLS